MTKINHSLNLSQKNLRLNLLGSASLALALSLPIAAWAAPQGGVVVGGTANITASGATTNITQSTNRAAINWNSFNVARDETVNFTVPNGGATLNRVIGGAASLIQGTVRSNGTLYLVNQNGLMFDATSKVYAQNFIATTSNIDPDKFMAGGRIQLEQSAINAKISLNGEIKAADRGIVGLFAPQVVNRSGTITANLGQVVLAGAQTAVIDFTGDGLMNFELGESVARNGETITSMNDGIISASGGKVVMTAKGAKSMMNALVGNSYEFSHYTDTMVMIDVSSHTRDGSVSIEAVNGTIRFASGIEANGSTDGKINLTAKEGEIYMSTVMGSNKKILVSQDIVVRSLSYSYLDNLGAGRDIIVTSSGTNSSNLVAGRDLILTVHDATDLNKIAVGRDLIVAMSGSDNHSYLWAITAGRDITIGASKYVLLQSNIAAGRDINAQATEHFLVIDNIAAGQDINFVSPDFMQLGGDIVSGRDFNFSSSKFRDGSYGQVPVILSGSRVIAHRNITFNYQLDPADRDPAFTNSRIYAILMYYAGGKIFINKKTANTPDVTTTPKPTPPVVTSKPAPAPILPPKTITVNIPNATGDQVMVDTTSKANVKALDSATGSYVVSVTSAKAPVSINLSFPDDRANWGNTEPEVTYDAATKLYTTNFIFGKSADGSVPDASKIKVTVNVATAAPKVVNTVANNLANFKMANPAPIASGGNNFGHHGDVNPLASSSTPINKESVNTGTTPSNAADSGNRILVKTRGITISENSDGGVTVVNQSNYYGWYHNTQDIAVVVTNGNGDATFVGTETTRNNRVYDVTIGSPPAKIPGLNVTTPSHGYKIGYGYKGGYGYGDYKYRFTTPSITAGGNIIINGVTVK